MGPFDADKRRAATQRVRRAGGAAKARAAGLGSWLGAAYHATTPIGRAEAARDRGDSRYVVELAIDHRTMRTVDQIEGIGWRLESVEYVQRNSTSTTTHPDGTTEVRQDSSTHGVYLFVRASQLG